MLEKFNLQKKICLITGGAGLLGKKHTEAIIEANGIPILLDIDEQGIQKTIAFFKQKYQKTIDGFKVDITNQKTLCEIKKKILRHYQKIDVLINNAANDPKIENKQKTKNWTRLENFPETLWQQDLEVGLKGAFLCSKIFGAQMAKQKKGVILNISSDLGIIAPDQRIYKKKGLSEARQIVKPVTYSVVKHGLIGLTKYLATYWADKNIRTNVLCPGGVYNEQDPIFIKKLTQLIPLKRMANINEYQASIIFLISDASSYMTGATIVVDGGRTCW